jgi:SAM-dependent methyltransferase
MHALDLLPKSTASLLDIGCNEGEFLIEVGRVGVKTLRGVDLNPAAVVTADRKLRAMFTDVSVVHASGDALPFADNSFDVVTCLEVLEHIPSKLRFKAISEMWRVIKPGGHLIVSVPFAGISGYLDPENLRFHLPWLYSVVNRVVGGVGKEAGYLGQKHGVVFHYHFTGRELVDLLEPAFEIERQQYRGVLLFPVGAWVRWPFYRRKSRGNPVCRLTEWAMKQEMRLPIPRGLAFNTLLRARRCESLVA